MVAKGVWMTSAKLICSSFHVVWCRCWYGGLIGAEMIDLKNKCRVTLRSGRKKWNERGMWQG